MTDKTEKKIKVLKFTCPDCEGNKVQSIETATLLYDIKYIDNEGIIDYGEQEIGEGASDSINHYSCPRCGFILGQLEGDIVDTPDDLVKWVKENCEQGE